MDFIQELKESANGLHDGMGGHADHCAMLMELAAVRISELQDEISSVYEQMAGESL